MGATDHLETARVLLAQSDNLEPEQDPLEWIQAAQVHALIAIAERLDALTPSGLQSPKEQP